MNRDRLLREALVAFAVATAATAALYWLSKAVGFVADYLPALVAIVFLYVPASIAWRQGGDLGLWGLGFRPLGRTAAFALGVPLVIFPLFLGAFYTFYAVICDPAQAGGPLGALAPPGLCKRFIGDDGFGLWRLPRDFVELAFSQLVVVALPEELFFRGYLLARLEAVWPPGRRVLGGGVGKALLVSALLFALGHVLVDLDPRRFAVFFPGLLFGWMRSATGNIAAGVAVHAMSNLYIDVLHRTFFR